MRRREENEKLLIFIVEELHFYSFRFSRPKGPLCGLTDTLDRVDTSHCKFKRVKETVKPKISETT